MFAQDFDEFGPFTRGGRSRGGFDPDFQGFDDKITSLRMGRGMMEPAILGALSDKPMHGYEIISYLEEKTHGMWRPSPGSVYPTLQLLEEKDLIEHTNQAGKKTYQLTAKGKEEATASREHLRKAFERFTREDRMEGKRMNLRHEYQRWFHKQAGETLKLLRQIFRSGTHEQKIAMENAIIDFKNRLEQIQKGEL